MTNVYILFKTWPYTSVDLDCCGNVFKAFQVLLNLPRSLFQDEGVTNKAFPTLDHIQHSLLLNNLNLWNQVSFYLKKKKRKKEKIAFGSSLILCEKNFHEFILKSDKDKSIPG